MFGAAQWTINLDVELKEERYFKHFSCVKKSEWEEIMRLKRELKIVFNFLLLQCIIPSSNIIFM